MMSVWVRDDLAGALAGDAFAALDGMSKDTVRRADNRHTFRMERGDSAYFVKMHEGVGWRQILEDLLTLKRPIVGAGNECVACRRLAQVGIRAPRVAAFGVRGANPATRRSFVVCDALTGFVSLTEREVSALVEVTILRDTVSVIWHYGRSLAQGRLPERERLEEMRHSTTWLKAHRAEIEALPLAAATGGTGEE